MTDKATTERGAGNAAILGVGRSVFEKRSDRALEALAREAADAALADAGLTMDAIDGIMTFGLADTIPAAGIATLLGIPRPRYVCSLDGGGNVVVSSLGYSAAAVQAGQASRILCIRALKARSGKRLGGTDEPEHLSTSGIRQFTGPYGWTAYAHTFALVARRYMIEHGISDERMQVAMRTVVQTARTFSSANPHAIMRDLISDEAYASSPMISDPLRRFDCCLESDGACAVIVGMPTPSDRAPVEIAAFVEGGSPLPGGDLLAFLELPDWSTVYASHIAEELFAKADLTAADMDFAMLYDNFTSNVLCQLEAFGFCGRGEAVDFVLDGNIGAGGALPVNPHGGLLAEAYNHGLNGVVEAVEQLRGESSGTQLAQHGTCLVASGGVGIGSALILKHGSR